jgi:hypothetical protein
MRAPRATVNHRLVGLTPSAQLAQFAREHNLVRSVCRTAVCWNNAHHESFWATLEVDFYGRYLWPTKAAAKPAVGLDRTSDNRRRRHSAGSARSRHAILARNLAPTPPVSDLFGKAGRHWLSRQPLPEDERASVQALLRQLDFHAHDLALVDKELANEALTDTMVARLMTIPGVDATAGIAIVAAVGDFCRFSNPDKLVAYVGLNPKVRQSGNSAPVSSYPSSRQRDITRLRTLGGPVGDHDRGAVCQACRNGGMGTCRSRLFAVLMYLSGHGEQHYFRPCLIRMLGSYLLVEEM